MKKLSDLFDMTLYSKMLAEKFIHRQFHPDYPLAILNYTASAAFDHKWNEVTRRCRGLIYDLRTEEIVARPFDKFFNYGEWDWIDDSYRYERAIITNKMDGSLGISYIWDDQVHVATRGSFTSDQAIAATEILRTKYGWWRPEFPEMTYLWEIIYPKNRIVLDYGETEDLFLLAGRHIDDGWTTVHLADWPGPRTEVMEMKCMQDALDAQYRPNAEGLVIHFPGRDLRIKLKQADYVELHRIIFGMNERTVWEMLKNGKGIAGIQEGVPEEFHPWIERTGSILLGKFINIYTDATRQLETILFEMEDSRDRKEFASHAVKWEYPGLLFKLYDKHAIDELVWKLIRPAGVNQMTYMSEDTA